MPAGLTVTVKAALCVCGGLLESVTLKLTGACTAVAVGVPEMMPEVLRCRPVSCQVNARCHRWR